MAAMSWRIYGPGSILIAALTAGAAPAVAADLGGDCCADLEERIAELEATTARKGNRKVSLTITGWVAEAVQFWDDGQESNVYVVQDSTDLGTNFAFTGTATINSDWSAGYELRVFVDQANSLFNDQNTDDATLGVNVPQSHWYLKSKTYGKLSVGSQFGAADNAPIFTDFTGTLFHANSVTFDGGSFFLRPENGTGALTTGRIQQLGFCNGLGFGLSGDCNGFPTNVVKYDTPVYRGFGASASWGEDDKWETALRYAGEGGGFKYSFAAAYGWTNGDGFVQADGVTPIDTENLQLGATIKHLPSALWYHISYGNEDTENPTVPSGQSWYMKVGFSPKVNTLGVTHFYAAYGENDGSNGFYELGSGRTCANLGGVGGNIGAACLADGGATNITDSSVLRLGAGVIQEIDAASMNIYAKWIRIDSEVDYAGPVSGVGKQEFDELNIIQVGAYIFF